MPHTILMQFPLLGVTIANSLTVSDCIGDVCFVVEEWQLGPWRTWISVRHQQWNMQLVLAPCLQQYTKQRPTTVHGYAKILCSTAYWRVVGCTKRSV